MHSKFNYFGHIDKLPIILTKLKTINKTTIMISENNILLEIVFKYTEENKETNIITKDAHIDCMIKELKQINFKGTISLRKTYGNSYIY